MKAPDLEKLLAAFEKAYSRADESLLGECVSPDFEWHQHFGNLPLGKVIRGIPALCEEIRWRKANWKNLRYENAKHFFAEAMIISNFSVSGIDERGRAFCVNAVDLYPVVEGKIAKKDTYWKYQTAE